MVGHRLAEEHSVLEYLPNNDGCVIAVKATGVLTEADYEAVYSRLEEVIAKRAPARGLADWEDLEGWRGNAAWYSFWLRVTNRHAFERVAIVAGETWRDEVAKLGKILDRGKVRLFPPSQREAAWAWLRED